MVSGPHWNGLWLPGLCACAAYERNGALLAHAGYSAALLAYQLHG